MSTKTYFTIAASPSSQQQPQHSQNEASNQTEGVNEEASSGLTTREANLVTTGEASSSSSFSSLEATASNDESSSPRSGARTIIDAPPQKPMKSVQGKEINEETTQEAVTTTIAQEATIANSEQDTTKTSAVINSIAKAGVLGSIPGRDKDLELSDDGTKNADTIEEVTKDLREVSDELESYISKTPSDKERTECDEE